MALDRSMTSFAKYFPLRNPTDKDFGRLCQSLWGWKDCNNCQNRGNCFTESCQWTWLPSLTPYRLFYRDVTYRYTSDDWFKSLPMLQTHGDLHRLIRFILAHPDTPRERLIANHSTRIGHAKATETDISRDFNLAYSMISMLPCAERNSFHVRCPGPAPVTWKKSQAACEVWEDSMPQGRNLTDGEIRLVTTKLSAKRLRDRGFEISNTNDPRLHLTIGSTAKRKQVYVFNQAGFLKQHLSSHGRCGSVARPVIPRQVAREILYTLRFILFNWDDQPSCECAAESGFELAYLGVDAFGFSFDDGFEDQQYRYWGAKLLVLVEVMDRSKVSHHVRSWTRTRHRWVVMMKRHPATCTMLALTALGVLVATVFGVFSLLMQKQEPM